ncbi:MAG: galactose-1-phosphate uridylyltransferase, partial [Clostridia bacterium]
IGIIEVMGLFILPGRLKSELEIIKQYLDGEKVLDLQELNDPTNPMFKHANLVLQLVNDHGAKNKPTAATKLVTSYVNKACEEILECTGVFKNNEQGAAAFDRFMKDGVGLED